jgi:ATPase family associated with various cellular activities (AAA)
MRDEMPDVGAFAAAFQEFLEAMKAAAVRSESPFVARLREHLGADPRALSATVAEFRITDQPNVQLALDTVLAGSDAIGYSAPHMGGFASGLSDLLAFEEVTAPLKLGPVHYADVEVGDGRVVRCVTSGVFLAKYDGAPVALVVTSASRPPYGRQTITLEGISPREGVVSALLRALREAMREHNVYRRRAISLHARNEEEGSVSVRFHALSAVGRDEVILPDGTLERLEQHALGIAAEAERLKRAGRHLKRGILLHGPPGTGKTLSVNYLLGVTPDRTTVLLTGAGLGLIEEAVTIARDLLPATVVLEDVDLIATERTMAYAGHGLLFELLNQMEGLADDADLLFLLTTNRPDLIEPALVARPGRIDLALELPLPDEAARRRLIRLYARDIELDDAVERDVVARTEGVSGAFVKELMRQAALRAALEEREPGPGDVTAVLDDLLADRSALTRRLLGDDSTPEMLRAVEAAGLTFPPGFE